MRRFLILVALLVPLSATAAVEVKGVRLWSAPDNTRVVFDLSQGVEHKLFTLHNPERVVIDLRDADLGAVLDQPEASDKFISRIRSAERKAGVLRMVLDLKQAARPKSFLLKPNAKYGHRLVLDLYQAKGDSGNRKVTQSQNRRSNEKRDVIVAIDAGHGGEDPGALGYRGTREKDVVFAIAKKLANEIKRAPGMRPVLVRDGDYFLRLRKRIEIARDNRADLFVSIHADAFHDKRAKGASVWVLAPHKAKVTETARWLAQSENSSDLIGGVSLDDKDDLVKTVLLDLSQTATILESLEAGDLVLQQLRGLGKVHKKRVEQAGFVVLKSPDIPSMLVETAFISNPAEEQKLRSPQHQQKVARALFSGIHAYFKKSPPRGTRMAANHYIIKRGDTLSGIAAQFQVNLNTLRSANGITDDSLRVGSVLRIPL